MKPTHSFASISDDELLRRLSDLLGRFRRNEADLVAHIGEVDRRRLFAREAAPSMFAYCVEVLHLSEAESYLRIAAARASREHPLLLTLLAEGRLHLTAIVKLAPHLTLENREALLGRAVCRSKREIEELVAELSPRPDAPPRIRKLSDHRGGTTSPVEPPPSDRLRGLGAEAASPGALQGALRLAARAGVSAKDDSAGHQLRPTSAGAECAGPHAPSEGELRPDGVGPIGLAPQPDRPRPPVVEPLAPARYKVQFTASKALVDKLERLRALMRSSMPDGDLAAIVEQAVTEKLQRLEARRFAQTQAPRKALSQGDAAPTTRHISSAVKRAVFERDEGRCRYVDKQGRRCEARQGLEFHHRHPFGYGGDHSVPNIALMCRRHNGYLAELDYGRETIARKRRSVIRAPGSTALSPP
jgi:hypothetical protein